MRQLHRKFSELYTIVNKACANEKEEKQPAVKKPRAKAPPKPKSSKASDGKKGAGNKKQANKENSDPDVLAYDEDDDEEIKASSNDQSSACRTVLDLTTSNPPVLESTTNLATKAKKPPAVKSTPGPKFIYIHRISYTCMIKLLRIYFLPAKSIKQESSNEEYESGEESLQDFYEQTTSDDRYLEYFISFFSD
jgi:hypothetical protein